MTDKKKDILEDVKEVDRKVRAKIVYDKIDDIKSMAKKIAELKEKTQVLLEELGVETEDVKRLIDYATNSPEAQLSEADKKEIRDDIKEEISESKEEVRKIVKEQAPTLNYYNASGDGTTLSATGGAMGMSAITGSTYTNCTNASAVPTFNMKG
jgi:L-serine deaminase